MTLKAENLSVRLGKTTVLRDVSLTAVAGQVTAIVGPNGSGKTTLLRALTGDVPYTGNTALNGTDIADIQAWKLASLRAVLPQATVLAFPFTVIEVVRIGLLGGAGGTFGTGDQTALAALSKVGLDGYQDRFYQEFSGGRTATCPTGAGVFAGLATGAKRHGAAAVSGRACVQP